MEKQYRDRHVDLGLLAEWIERFFVRGEFRVSKDVEKDGYRITAKPTYVHDMVDRIVVTVSGSSNDFTLAFYSGSHSEALKRFGQLAQLFGTGVLFLRGIKSDEAIEKVERAFWKQVEEKIDYLAGSAQPARSA